MYVRDVSTAAANQLRVVRDTSAALATANRIVTTGLRVSQASDSPLLFTQAATIDVKLVSLRAERTSRAVSELVTTTHALALATLRGSVTAIKTALVKTRDVGADKTALQTEIRALGKTILGSLATLGASAAKLRRVEEALGPAAT